MKELVAVSKFQASELGVDKVETIKRLYSLLPDEFMEVKKPGFLFYFHRINDPGRTIYTRENDTQIYVETTLGVYEESEVEHRKAEFLSKWSEDHGNGKLQIRVQDNHEERFKMESQIALGQYITIEAGEIRDGIFYSDGAPMSTIIRETDISAPALIRKAISAKGFRNTLNKYIRESGIPLEGYIYVSDITRKVLVYNEITTRMVSDKWIETFTNEIGDMING